MTRGRCQVPWESPNHRLHGFGGTGHLCRLACRIHPQAAVVGKTRSKIEDWIDHRHGCSDGSSRRPSAQCDTTTDSETNGYNSAARTRLIRSFPPSAVVRRCRYRADRGCAGPSSARPPGGRRASRRCHHAEPGDEQGGQPACSRFSVAGAGFNRRRAG